uniref:Uncharacterized protein n=1 Tax=Anguilla anguilla TaxID=7936 RepID=A0A0E9PKX3_ANGAN
MSDKQMINLWTHLSSSATSRI